MLWHVDVCVASRAGDFRNAFQHHLCYSPGVDISRATTQDLFCAVSLAVRKFCIDGMQKVTEWTREQGAKQVFYLSIEFLMGQSLENNLRSLGLFEACCTVMSEAGIDVNNVLHPELDAGLGNGGLGRLAACFPDSLASLHMPDHGYGINYEFGLFRQLILGGYQRELPDQLATDRLSLAD